MKRATQVVASDIEEICASKLKIDAEGILSNEIPAVLADAVRQLQRASETYADGGGAPPTLDPEKDLKINQFDLVQAIRERRRLVQVGVLFKKQLAGLSEKAVAFLERSERS